MSECTCRPCIHCIMKEVQKREHEKKYLEEYK